MTIKELEKEYKKKIAALKRSANYYEKQGRDTSALRELIKEFTKDSNVRTKTGRIKKQVLRDLESVRTKGLIDKQQKAERFKEQIRKNVEENKRIEKKRAEAKAERQKQIDKQKAKIRMAIERKIESTLNKIKEADPHTEAGQPLYNKIKEIYTSYTDTKTKDDILNIIIRNLQKQFGEEGLKKGYRIWGQYGLKKVEDAYTQIERYNKYNEEAKATIEKMPLPLVKECYITTFCYNKSSAFREDWEDGQYYFVKLHAVKSEKQKNGKTRTVNVYTQENYLKNVEAIKYISEKDYTEIEGILATFYI